MPSLIGSATCESCKFYKPSDDPTKWPNVCRRFPPVMAPDEQTRQWLTCFTIIASPAETWCGEHKPKITLS